MPADSTFDVVPLTVVFARPTVAQMAEPIENALTVRGGLTLPLGQVIVAATDDVLATRPDRLDGLLSAVERRRAAALRRPRDRRDFLAAHVLVRLCAANALEVPAATLTVVQTCTTCGGPHGRPSLAGHGDVHLSLAHTTGWVAAAVAADPVGVDVERLVREPVDPALLDLALSPPERSAVDAADDPALAFRRLWVRKEALVKLGWITLDTLHDIDVSGLPGPDGARDEPRRPFAEALHLLEWYDPHGEVVAAAASRQELRLVDWPVDVPA